MKGIKTSLQMEDEIALHEKGWIVQRVGWVILILLLVAAALGVFGDGVLSNRQESAGNVSISYQGFGRFESQTEIKINAESVQHGMILRVPQNYLRVMEIEKVVPEPTSQKIQDDHVVLTLDAQQLAEVTVYLKPKTTGNVSASIHVNEARFNISHFIYP
jgi:hypothetical protein